ncbi:hypothetical protein DM860_002040 [Cuscuta australis]|uniref:Glucan endo-1,3-beta-D-glucosidase n=1 Tax=Cuscuta australis TaxID=267555 RepID=A0A328DZG5_9ASTE|nr:hypothetical protein DM860_002040 [Cuscuta australis]
MGVLWASYFQRSLAAFLIILGLSTVNLNTAAQTIGVCYGRNGDNLPPEAAAINLATAEGIAAMRVYDPVPPVLDALRGADIQLVLGIPNADLPSLSDPAAANDWVNTVVLCNYPDVEFKYISVGNEVLPTTAPDVANFLLPVMQNVYNALAAAGLQDAIRVSTATLQSVLNNTYPPSASVFRDDLKMFLVPILQFLAARNLPLLANVYTYFAYVSDPAAIPLPFALIDPAQPPNAVGYTNLFDASLDAFYFALASAEFPGIDVVVSETGWPSAGGEAAETENAVAYYRNIIAHVKGNAGTPFKPGKPIEAYLFAMFDEDLKTGAEVEKHWGLFYPDQTPKYPINFYN